MDKEEFENLRLRVEQRMIQGHAECDRRF